VNHEATVADAILPSEGVVMLRPTDMLRAAIEQVSQKRQGLACIVEEERLVGVFSDGDFRRVLLMDHKPIAALFAEDIRNFMTTDPKTIRREDKLEDAVTLMEAADIYDLPVVDDDKRVLGLLHMHTALKHLLGL
jgi:arabinose-5-phosphate isomerase